MEKQLLFDQLILMDALASQIPTLGKILLVLIVSSFMPLSAISFFRFQMPKKIKDYHKAINDMGISTSRSVEDSFAPKRYLLPLVFVTVICITASFSFAFAGQFVSSLKDSPLLTGSFFGLQDNDPLIRQSIVILGYAFLGSFLWSSGVVIRRLIAYDLPPNVYYSAGVRIIMASIVALLFSFLISNEYGNQIPRLQSSLSIIAFLTGMFPDRILNYLLNLYQKYFSPNRLNREQLNLDRIEGMSQAHKERLNEMGIDNAQNLATASLTQMCIETPYAPRQLLDWIGQAKLLCYVKDDIDKLRSVGIRSVFDFYLGDKSIDNMYAIAESTQMHPSLLQNISQQVLEDRGIRHLFQFLTGVNTPEEDTYQTGTNFGDKGIKQVNIAIPSNEGVG